MSPYSWQTFKENLGIPSRGKEKETQATAAFSFQPLDGVPVCYFDSEHGLDEGSYALRSNRSGELYHFCASCYQALAELMTREGITHKMMSRVGPSPKAIQSDDSNKKTITMRG
jgi:hypothetical protein